jgi:hypothetical protein
MASHRSLSFVIAMSDTLRGERRSVAMAPWRRNLLCLLLVLALIGCTPAAPSGAPSGTVVPADSAIPPERAFLTPAPPTESPPLTGISAQQVRNAFYQLGFTDVPRTVQFTDGVFQQGTSGSADFMEIRVTDFIALGDINGDGVNEAAAIISENYGGTGVFVFMALYLEQEGQPVYRASAFIDDRPAIDAIGFEDNEISLVVTTHGTADPFCCPTLRNERHYRLINNQLEMTDYATFTPDGRLRTITIESPVNGAEVFSSVQLKGTVAVAPFENNLTFRIYDVGGVELSAGAIGVTAADAGAPGTFDSMIPLGSILSGALIRIEIQDISAADGSLFAMDSVELVVK